MTNKEMQSILFNLGLYKGKIDGSVGPITKAAIRKFQRQIGVSPTGTLRFSQLKALALSSHQLPPTVKSVMSDIRLENIPSQVEAAMTEYYGPIGTKMTTLILPFPMIVAWDKTQVIHKFTLHEKCIPSATRVFNKIAEAYPDPKVRRELGIDIWGGSLNVRKKRGGTTWSIHSWGAAIDFDPERNQLHWGKELARLARPDCVKFWEIWEAEGWVSLGRSKNMDYMHVQRAKI